MNEKLLKFVEDLANTLRYHEHILQDENMKEHHEESHICKDVLTPIYYDIKNILQSLPTTTKTEKPP